MPSSTPAPPAGLDEAAIQARFDLSVARSRTASPTRRSTAVDQQPASSTRSSVAGIETIVDLGRRRLRPTRARPRRPRSAVAGHSGRRRPGPDRATQWQPVGGRPEPVVGGRLAPDRPGVLLHPRREHDRGRPCDQLRLALGVGVLVLVRHRAASPPGSSPAASLRPVDEASRRPSGSSAATCRRACRSRRADEFGAVGRPLQPDGRRRSRTRSAGSRPPRPRTGASSPTSRTSCGRRSPRSSPRRRSCATHLDALPPDAPPRRRARSSPTSRRLRDPRRRPDGAVALRRRRRRRSGSEPVDLGRVVRDVARPACRDAVLELPDEPVVVETDPRRLERIVGNLLDNAREHAAGRAGRGPPRVRRRRASGSPSPIAGRACRRTGCSGSSSASTRPIRRASGGGSGLGLAIAAEHAALLGGGSAPRNRDGRRARVELRLPVTRPLPGGDPMRRPGGDEGRGR